MSTLWSRGDDLKFDIKLAKSSDSLPGLGLEYVTDNVGGKFHSI
jgi:hypothetical protein